MINDKFFEKKPVISKEVEEKHKNFDSFDIRDKDEEERVFQIIHGVNNVLEKQTIETEESYDTQLYQKLLDSIESSSEQIKKKINNMQNDPVYGKLIQKLFNIKKSRSDILKNENFATNKMTEEGRTFILSKTEYALEETRKQLLDNKIITLDDLENIIDHFLDMQYKVNLHKSNSFDSTLN